MSLMMEAAEVFEQLEFHERETDSFFNLMDQTDTISSAVSRFGINPTAVTLLSAKGLLLNTCLDGVAIEHISFDGPNGIETQLALEAINDNQQSVAAVWSAKILGFLKTVGGKLLSVLSGMMNKIGELLKKAGSSLKDKAGDGVRYVKAHPVKVIVGLIASIAAVAGIMIYSASNLAGAAQTRQAMEAFTAKFKQMTDKIPWPFGKPKVSGESVKDFRIDVVFPPRNTVQGIPIDKLGWNQQAARAIGRQFDAASKTVKTGFTTFGAKTYEAVKKYSRAGVGMVNQSVGAVADLTGSKVIAGGAAFAVGAILFRLGVSLVYAVYRLLRKVVIGALHLIWNTLKAVF